MSLTPLVGGNKKPLRVCSGGALVEGNLQGILLPGVPSHRMVKKFLFPPLVDEKDKIEEHNGDQDADDDDVQTQEFNNLHDKLLSESTDAVNAIHDAAVFPHTDFGTQ
jgi:hypothetical protein